MGMDIITLLADGDKRTVHGVDRAVNLVLRQPELLAVLINGFNKADEALNMRIADTLQKVYVEEPELLNSHLDRLFNIFEEYEQKEIQWHMAQILPGLGLGQEQLSKAVKRWEDNFYHSKSSIVRTFSLQAIFDIAENHKEYTETRNRLLNSALGSGTQAMKARAKSLLNSLGN